MNTPKELPSQQRLRELFDYVDGRLIRKQGKAVAGSRTSNGYCRITIDGSEYKLHRVIWMWHTGDDPGLLDIDHIDRNPSNNHIENLRKATRRQNKLNSGPYKKRLSHLPTGVSFRGGSYQARAHNGGRCINVGNFKTIEEAVAARDNYLSNQNNEQHT